MRIGFRNNQKEVCKDGRIPPPPLLTKPEKIRMLENSSIKNGDEQEEYIFKTLRESGSLAERPLGNT